MAIRWAGVHGDEGRVEWTDQRWEALGGETHPGEQQDQRAQSRPDRVGIPPSADHVCLWSPDRAVTWPCSQPMSLSTMASPTLSPDSSSQEALSAPTCSPTSDSENLSPDELELLAKLEEQNR